VNDVGKLSRVYENMTADGSLVPDFDMNEVIDRFRFFVIT